MKSAITLHDLSFAWPDGAVVLDRVNGSFPTGRTGLVGRNGVGKSTLLKLMAGILTPTEGRIDRGTDVVYLPQNLTLSRTTTVARLLGIDRVLDALRAIEAGDVAQEHFDTVGDDWDIESRAVEALDGIGFPAEALHRRVPQLSGGEAMLIAVTGLRLRHSGITLLDEPTNNLDRPTRARLRTMVQEWPGSLVIVSHDLELLEVMEQTTELHDGVLETFGGPYSAWREHREQAHAAAVQAAQSAQQLLRTEKRQRQEAEAKLARRERTAKKTQHDGGIPKILAGNRASKAQVSAGNLRGTLNQKVAAAQAAVDAADARVREEQHVSLVLPDPDVPRGRRIAELSDGEHHHVIQGPDRIALVGPNGAGKTSLLQRLLKGAPVEPGLPGGRLLTDRVGYLPQRLDGLDDAASPLANIQRVAPGTPAGTIRNQLARLLLRGTAADRPVRTLSGGERFRASLAMLLLADPPAQLLILDEPSNNLDVPTVGHLAEALETYRGAVLIVSHDHVFLDRLGLDAVLAVDHGGTLTRRRSLDG